MGNVPSTHIFIENLCGAGYEMRFPEDAHMKPSGGHDALLEAFVYCSSVNPNRLYRRKWGENGVKSLFLTVSCHFGKHAVDGEATPNPV
jgi:hypothetical protein